MSISREFGETLNECKKIQKLLNKENLLILNYALMLVMAILIPKIKIILILISG